MIKRQTDIILASASSVYSWIQNHGANIPKEMIAYGPGVLTMIYVGLKIYYKIKNNRKLKETKHGNDTKKSRTCNALNCECDD